MSGAAWAAAEAAAGAENASPAAETVSLGADPAEAGEAGVRHAGFVSAVDGVARFAVGGGAFALDEASAPDPTELANSGREKPASVSSRAMEAAASEAVLSVSSAGSASADLADAILLGVTIGSGAEEPRGLAGAEESRGLAGAEESSGLAGVSARPLPCGRDSPGGGGEDFGTVTSERLPSAGFVRDGASAAVSEVPGSGEGSSTASVPEGESPTVEAPDADALLVLPWTAVFADDAPDPPAVGPDALAALPASPVPALLPASPSAAAFALEASASRDFLPDSACAALDFRTVLSSSALAPAASSPTSAT